MGWGYYRLQIRDSLSKIFIFSLIKWTDGLGGFPKSNMNDFQSFRNGKQEGEIEGSERGNKIEDHNCK